MASAQASEQRDSACSFRSAKLTCLNTNFSDSSPVASITACTLAKNSHAGWGAFQMPHLQEVFAPLPSLPVGFSSPSWGRCARGGIQHPHGVAAT